MLPSPYADGDPEPMDGEPTKVADDPSDTLFATMVPDTSAASN